MMKQAIVKVEKPDAKDSLYRVWFSYNGINSTSPAYMTEKSYKVLVLEQELIKAGVDEKKLQEFKEAVIEHRDEEISFEEEY
jgi:type II secretory pathway component PulK